MLEMPGAGTVGFCRAGRAGRAGRVGCTTEPPTVRGAPQPEQNFPATFAPQRGQRVEDAFIADISTPTIQ